MALQELIFQTQFPKHPVLKEGGTRTLAGLVCQGDGFTTADESAVIKWPPMAHALLHWQLF